MISFEEMNAYVSGPQTDAGNVFIDANDLQEIVDRLQSADKKLADELLESGKFWSEKYNHKLDEVIELQSRLDEMEKQEPALHVVSDDGGCVYSHEYKGSRYGYFYAKPIPAQQSDVVAQPQDSVEPYHIVDVNKMVCETNDYHLVKISKCRDQIQLIEKLIEHHRERHAEVIAAENARIVKDYQPSTDHIAGSNMAPDDWRLARFGQVKVGDVLSFDLADRRICTTAKEIVNKGTNREKIIYNRKKNYYFITSMILDGTSSHENVYIVPPFAPPGDEVQS